MEPIYITGHRNPDTDSIVAAISYAMLKNALGERAYIAARIGERASSGSAWRTARSTMRPSRSQASPKW